MVKRKIMFGLICVVVGFTAQSLSAIEEPSKKASASNKPNVAIQAFELRMAGQVDEAKELLEKAVAANPQNAAAQFELSRVHFYMASETLDLAQAQKTIEKAIKIKPDNPWYHYWAGEIACYNGILKMHGFLSRLEMPGQMNKAIKHFKQAVDLKPDFHEARLELMGMYDRLPWYCGGSKSKAQKHEQILVELGGDPDKQPDPDMALLHAGLEYIREKKFESAEQKIREYLEINPVIPLRAYGLSQLARIHWLEGRKAEAEELRKQAEQLDKYYWPTSAPPPENLFKAP